MTYFTELNSKDMNEVNGGGVLSALAKFIISHPEILITVSGPIVPIYR
jgi:bacteriocin-like protein